MIIETERLRLRSMRAGDVADLVRLWTDPEVTRPMGGPREEAVLQETFSEDLGRPAPEADDLWPVEEDPDIVVCFDDSPVKIMFWRGTRYGTSWVSENGKWMTDQSVESWDQTEGCFEHMQDRRCRYSHVRIIENHDARVVVHWRYAPVSVYDHLWREDEKTGRACWVDEYYTIYPDAIGVRRPTWKRDTLGGPRQFQESLPLTNPGQLQGDVVEADWVTLANLAGEQGGLSFVENPQKTKDGLPKNLTLQRYNFKSPTKPFIAFERGNQMKYLRDRNIAAIKKYEEKGVYPPIGERRDKYFTLFSRDRRRSKYRLVGQEARDGREVAVIEFDALWDAERETDSAAAAAPSSSR